MSAVSRRGGSRSGGVVAIVIMAHCAGPSYFDAGFRRHQPDSADASLVRRVRVEPDAGDPEQQMEHHDAGGSANMTPHGGRSGGTVRARVQRSSVPLLEGYPASPAKHRQAMAVTSLSSTAAALTARGATKIGGSSFIDGNDHTYPGWDCPATGPALAGIAASDTSQITTAGCNNYRCVAGSPKVVQTPAAADTNTYFNFGSLNWTQLRAMASKYANGGDGAASVVNVVRREYLRQLGSLQGERGPCVDNYPTSTTGSSLDGGRGQGILW